VTTVLAAFDWQPWARAGAYLVITIVVVRLLDWLLGRHARSLPRVLGRPLNLSESSRWRAMRRLIVAVALFVGLTLTLIQIPQVGSLAKGMIASAGITALVVGLAARSPIANFVSGMIIAFAQPIRIGDLVTIDDVTGTVEEIRPVYTYIRTADNRRVLIPNEQLTSKVIHNYSLIDETSSAGFDFEVPVTAPLPQVADAVLDVLRGTEGGLAGREPSLEVTAVTVGAVHLRATLWAQDWTAATDMAARAQHEVAERLQAAGLLGGAEAAGTEAAGT
jgi:small-conductance mechanosensitive channel